MLCMKREDHKLLRDNQLVMHSIPKGFIPWGQVHTQTGHVSFT